MKLNKFFIIFFVIMFSITAFAGNIPNILEIKGNITVSSGDDHISCNSNNCTMEVILKNTGDILKQDSGLSIIEVINYINDGFYTNPLPNITSSSVPDKYIINFSLINDSSKIEFFNFDLEYPNPAYDFNTDYLKDNSIGSSQIINNSIKNQDFKDYTLGVDDFNQGMFESRHLVNDSVTREKINDNAIESDHVIKDFNFFNFHGAQGSYSDNGNGLLEHREEFYTSSQDCNSQSEGMIKVSADQSNSVNQIYFFCGCEYDALTATTPTNCSWEEIKTIDAIYPKQTDYSNFAGYIDTPKSQSIHYDTEVLNLKAYYQNQDNVECKWKIEDTLYNISYFSNNYSSANCNMDLDLSNLLSLIEPKYFKVSLDLKNSESNPSPGYTPEYLSDEVIIQLTNTYEYNNVSGNCVYSGIDCSDQPDKMLGIPKTYNKSPFEKIELYPNTQTVINGFCPMKYLEPTNNYNQSAPNVVFDKDNQAYCVYNLNAFNSTESGITTSPEDDMYYNEFLDPYLYIND